MLLLSPAWTHETRFPLEAGILELWDTPVPIISGTFVDSVCSSLPHHGLGELVSSLGRCTGPYYFTIRPDGLGHGLRSRRGHTSQDFRDLGACPCHYTSGRTCRSVGHSGYIYTLSLMEKSIIDYGASHSFVSISCVKDLGLEVKTLEEPLHVSSPLGSRVSVDQICRGIELEISGILLTVDLRVMDMSEFDIILGIDWLMEHRVCDTLKSGGLLINHQPMEALWILCNPIPHRCVAFTRIPYFYKTEQNPCGYRVTRYHIVHPIHRDPSFYKTGQSPLSCKELFQNHPAYCTML